MVSKTDCGIYFIDENYRIIHFNKASQNIYPELEKGQYCYKALEFRNEPCPHCPLMKQGGQNSFYNPRRSEWIQAQSARLELPEFGDCYSITFSRLADRPASASDSDDSTGMIGGYCEEGFPLFFANKKMISMLGYDDYDDFCKGINGLVANTIHPDDMHHVIDDLGTSYYVGQEYTTTYRMPRKDGSWFWTVDKGHVIKADDGRLAIVSYCTDITDSMTKQEQLENQNQLLRQQNRLMEFINDGMPGGYHRCDDSEGYPFRYVSSKFLNMLGFTREELREKFDDRFINLVHPDDRDLILNVAEEALSRQGDSEINIHYRIITKDGYLQVVDSTKISEYEGTRFFQGVIIDISKDENIIYDRTAIENIRTALQSALIREQNYRDQLTSLQDEILDSISCGVYAYTLPDHRLLVVNNAAKAIIGCGENDDPMQSLKSFLVDKIIPEDKEKVADVKNHLVNTGDSCIQNYCAEVNGKRVYVHSNIKLLEANNGLPYILVTMLDITRQELSEKRIDSERLQYRNALAYGSSGFFTVDLAADIIDEPIISRTGDDITALLGLTLPTDFDTLSAAFFSDERITAPDDILALVRKRKSLIDACRNGTSLLDLEYNVPDDNKYYRMIVLLYEIDNSVYASFIVYDISSDRKEEKQRRSIIESIGSIYSALYLFSFTDNTCSMLRTGVDVSSRLSERCSLSDFYKVYTDEFVADEHKELIREFLNPDNIKSALMDEACISIEFRHSRLGWCRVTLVVADRDRNGIASAVVFAGNVIEKQKQEELAQQEALRAAFESANIANSAKTNFLANMSHDIRTPMNAIIGMTAIAGTHLDDKERVADCLSKISISSKHLLGIINEVLDMSKIESGKMELQEEEFNLPELIDNLLTMSKPSINAKMHELAVSIRNISHENVIGDSQRIQQVFMNLMNNAVKYTPENGRIELTISEKATNKQKIGCYEFIFEDNGIGMSEEFVKHIFEPFSRATDDSRLENIQGTGLGMPITQNIIHMMNGTIDVKSELNKGTKITVEIFLKLQTDEDLLPYEKLVDLSVLVVDDDEYSCIYTCELLGEIGMKGDWVLTGREAIERTLEHHKSGKDFFAVIIDWKMPEMDGVETTRRIRKELGDEIPIIIISAYDWSEIEPEARQAGANAFISKPLFKSRVVHLFNELIGGETAEKSSSGIDAVANEDFSGRRALLVEDNAINAEIAGEILGMTGLEVEYAVNGRDALNMISTAEDGHFDIIFMDIQMPVMNGYEAARAIRELPSDYAKYVPIIAMTANAFAEDVAAAKNAGMNEHIAKPLDFSHLIKALRKWLRQ